MVVVFDRVDMAIPYWRPCLRSLLVIKVLHVWSLHADDEGLQQDYGYTVSMGIKDSPLHVVEPSYASS